MEWGRAGVKGVRLVGLWAEQRERGGKCRVFLVSATASSPSMVHVRYGCVHWGAISRIVLTFELN